MMATVTKGSVEKIEELLGVDARDLLEHRCETVPKEQLHLPGGDFVDRVWKDSDRPTRVLRSFESLLDHGRLAGTGYLSLLTRSTSTAARSSSWPSRAAATRSPRPSASWARWPGATPTGSPSSASSTTTSS